MAESDAGMRSTFEVALGLRAKDTPEDRADAITASRTILMRLSRIGDPHAGVLDAAYATRPSPLALREELGRLTGIVVRLGSAEVGLSDDPDERDRLEAHMAVTLADGVARKDDPDRARLRFWAMTLLQKAFDAYVRARGGPGVRAVRRVVEET